MKILLEKFEYTKPIAEMMAGRFDSISNFGESESKDSAALE